MAWVSGTLLLTLLIVVTPTFFLVKRSFDAALVRDQLQVLRRIHESWTAAFNTRLNDSEASISRVARMLTAELETRHDIAPSAFDDLVARDPDGCFRSRAERYNPARDAGIYVPPGYPLDDAERAFFLETKRLIERYQTGTAADYTNTWALPRKGGEVIHWPSLPGFIRELNASIDYTTTDWVTLAAPERNPEGKPRWTPTSYDPGAHLWMISVVAPFGRGGAFAGSVGHDLTINALASRLADLMLFPDTEYHLITTDGTLLASSRHEARIQETKGTARIQEVEDPELQRIVEAMRERREARSQVFDDPDAPRAFIAAHLAGPDWYLLLGVPRTSVIASVQAPYNTYWLALVAALLSMLVVPVLVMSRVLLPAVRRMIVGAGRIREGDLGHRFDAGSSREITHIGGALNAMIERLQATIKEREAAEAALGEKEALARAMLEEREKNEQELRRRLEVIEQQQEAIRAMSTPIIQVWDHVLALPVVGQLDSARAEAILQTLLDAISERQARFAILDLTGVTAVDATTADLVIKVMRAVNLLGARGIVTGLRSEFATQMVSLGVDLSGITTLGTLREALRVCLRPGAAQAR